MIFSHVLYQLSYLGIRFPDRQAAKRSAPLIVALAAVQSGFVGTRTGDPVAFAEPLQEVAVLTTAAAERLVFGMLGLAA